MRYLYALAGFTDPALAARTFELARTEVRTQNAPFVIQLLLANRDNGPATWARVREHWDELVARIPGQHPPPHARRGDVVVPRPAARRRRHARSSRAHPLPIGQRTVDQTLERLGDQRRRSRRRCATRPCPVLSAGLQRLETR